MNTEVPSASQLERYFQAAVFETSAAKLNQCPHDDGLEIAFAGRSNAGKSSAINRITQQKKLARTGKTPGRTQLINFFRLPDGQRLVDLPGYGYAKVSTTKKLAWQKHLENYLEHRRSLTALILLVDCRHPLQPFDQMMLEWADRYAMACHVLLTKADKLSRNAGKQALFGIEKAIKPYSKTTIQMFSSLSDIGLVSAQREIFTHLHPPDAVGK